MYLLVIRTSLNCLLNDKIFDKIRFEWQGKRVMNALVEHDQVNYEVYTCMEWKDRVIYRLT